MIFLSDDAFSYIKRNYMKTCIVLFMGFACLYTISKKVNDIIVDYILTEDRGVTASALACDLFVALALAFRKQQTR